MYKLSYNYCNCHPETCCCDPYVILDPNGNVYTTISNKKTGQEIVFDNIEKTKEYVRRNYESIGGINEESRIMKFKKNKEDFHYKNYYCPLITALTTAEARIIMYHIYKSIGKEKLIYTDTDSCLS